MAASTAGNLGCALARMECAVERRWAVWAEAVSLNGMRLSVEEHKDYFLLRNGEAISWRVPRSLDGGLLDSVLVPPLEYLRPRGAPALVL